jgi:hypothetical protein
MTDYLAFSSQGLRHLYKLNEDFLNANSMGGGRLKKTKKKRKNKKEKKKPLPAEISEYI